MEKPLCRLCGSRHWSHEEHRFPENAVVEVGPIVTSPALVERVRKAVAEVEGKSPVPKKIASASPHRPMSGADRSKIVEQPDGTAVYGAGCPVCAERKRRQAEATKKWRSKKAGGR